jgi:hypothetical protein
MTGNGFNGINGRMLHLQDLLLIRPNEISIIVMHHQYRNTNGDDLTNSTILMETFPAPRNVSVKNKGGTISTNYLQKVRYSPTQEDNGSP